VVGKIHGKDILLFFFGGLGLGLMMKTEFYTILILTILVERKILVPGWFFLVFTGNHGFL